jgi:DnaK suppressor protein
VDAEVRDRIADRRAEAVESLRAVARDVNRIVAASQLTSSDDEHDPEGSTIAFERAQTLAVADQLRRGLAELDAATARLDAGTYGICEVCGGQIPEARLLARPTATRCIACASR